MPSSPASHSTGFSLVEMLLTLAVLAFLGAGAFILYPKLVLEAHADADKRAMSAVYANITGLMRPLGATGFNADPGSSTASLESDPLALASMLKPFKCDTDWGSLRCKSASGSDIYVDFMSKATCQDEACSSVGAPFTVFSMRLSFYDVSVDSCLALVRGFGGSSSPSAASGIYVIGSDYRFKPLFLNTATVPVSVSACQDPSGTNAVVMFDFWPFGDAFGQYPAWG